MNEEQVKKDCESRFQAGTQRTQIVEADGQFIRGYDSVRLAKFAVCDPERIYTRKKVDGKYQWVRVFGA